MRQSLMIVHFVCLGNVYRSRLAETYFNSKGLVGSKAISSGIGAAENKTRPISWLTQRLFEVYKLVPFEKSLWTQTAKEVLDSAELTIFFDKKYYDYCVENCGFKSESFEIWPIADLDPNVKEHVEKIKVTEEAFEVIRQKVDDLILRFHLD